MKFGVRKTAGNAVPSADKSRPLWLVALALIVSGAAFGQSLYKYRGDDGEWIYTDRAPADGEEVAEVRELPQGWHNPEVRVSHEVLDGQVRFSVDNEYYAPVELVLALDDVLNVTVPANERQRSWLLRPRSSAELMRLDIVGTSSTASVEYRFTWFPGDPEAEHRPHRAYRVPFAIAGEHRISQAYPSAITHNTPDSRYAVDFSMPIGTDIYAARGGTVVEVASGNYRGGFDTSRNGAKANLVRILHDDGTFAVYAHLNWNSIRVQPGDQVDRGEYIADSGNTGFSSGPHLHFVVEKNTGLAMESVPIVFEGRNSSIVTPEVGQNLTAY